MTKSKEVIVRLKQVREEKGYSFGDIAKIMKAKGIPTISKSTLSRLFSDEAETINFDYEYTIRPVAEALLDTDTIEENDDTDTKAMKSFIQYKKSVIDDLERRLKEADAEKDKAVLKAHEKFDVERKQLQETISLLREQVAFKDKRIDSLMASNDRKEERIEKKDELYQDLLKRILECPNFKRKECE